MPLTHVCVWDGKNGYRRVTIEEASKMYPYGVSANRGIFVCSLCAQNVGLTAPGANIRHFRHTSAAQKKECEDRAQAYAKISTGYNCHPMPLRIKVGHGNYMLELGFFYARNIASGGPSCKKITIIGDRGQEFTHSFERFYSEGITYLNIGSVPSTYYRLLYDYPSPNLNRYWPSSTAGVDSKGAFFECSSGKMLQPGSKAYPFQDYYLLQRRTMGYVPHGISYERIAETRLGSFITWYLYRIRVQSFSVDIARFFLERSIFLTEKPVTFSPVWPPYIEGPYFVYHNDPKMYFYIQGEDTELNIYPENMSTRYECIGEGKLYRLYAASKEQLLSLGQSGAIGFSYLMTRQLDMIAPSPQVQIKSIDGKLITENICKCIPKGKQITLQTPFDGKVVIYRNKKIIETRRIISEQIMILDELCYESEIHIYQGCDLIRTIKFEQIKEKTDLTLLDQQIVRELRNCKGPIICIPHSIGVIAQELLDLPLSKGWLYQTIRRGKIPIDAVKLLTSYKNRKMGE